MSSEKLHDWLGLAGMAAVVGSLVFVGLQLKQAHEIARAGQYQARAEMVMAHLDAMLQSEQWLTGDTKRFPERSDVENAARCINQSWILQSYDNHHYQHELGFMDAEAFSALTKRFVAYTLNHGCNAVENNKTYFRVSFRQHVEELAAAHPKAPISSQRLILP